MSKDCKTCVHDGMQMLYPSGCTGCGAHDERLNHRAKPAPPVAVVQQMMSRLADILDEDQFAEIENIAVSAGIEPPVDVQEYTEKDSLIQQQEIALELKDKRIAELERKLAEQQAQSSRYERLRILGCAPYGSIQLESWLVLRFQNLDAFIDSDLAQVKSRGDFRGGERDELNTLLAQAREEGRREAVARIEVACRKALEAQSE